MDRDQLAEIFFGERAEPAPWATESPVRFDAWWAFAQPSPQGPQHLVDLILTVNEEHGVRKVLDSLVQAPLATAQPIAAGSFVVAKLTLEALVRTILPLTNLYPVLRLARKQTREALIATMASSAPSVLVDDPLEGTAERRAERDSQLAWLLKILETVVTASWEEPPRRRGRNAKAPEPAPPPRPAPRESVADMVQSALLDPQATTPPGPSASRVVDRRRRYPVTSVTTNRPSSTAVTRSRSTIKSDAAEQLFSVDCSGLGWAVVDSGIDALHPAFADWADWNESMPDQPPPQTRVLRAFDFVQARNVLASDPVDPGLVDWRRDLPKLEITLPVANPAPPSADTPQLPYVPPADAHGTHVAGILAGWWPKQQFRGICPGLRLYDFRVLDRDGIGDEFTIVTALQAIRHINEQAGRLAIAGVNVSLSVPHDVATYSAGLTPVCVECDRLVRSGVVVVAAAGNAGYRGVTRTRGFDYRTVSISDPGNAELVITVGSTHRSDPHRHGVSYFSSRGPTADGRRKPDLLAPGEDIDGPMPDSKISAMQGTSQAAAHVSGAAAMLIARYRELLGRPERVKQTLCTTATDLSRERDFQGHGLVDVLRAMQSL
jgi:hypothetical protein